MEFEILVRGVSIGRCMRFPGACFAYAPDGTAIGTFHDLDAAALGLARLAERRAAA